MKQVAGGAGAMHAGAQALDEGAAIMADAGSLLRLSALADGELPVAEANATLGRLLAEPALRAAWDEIHLVGDALRSDELPAMGSASGASVAFAARLAAEPVVLAPGNLDRQRRVWLRYALPMGTAVVIMLGMSWTLLPQFAAAPLVAKSAPAEKSAPVAVAPPAPVPAAVDTAKLQEYLSAHREFSAASWRRPDLVQPAGMSSPAIPAR